MQIRRRIRYLYYRFIRMRSTPDEVARGLAVGIFIGFTPTIPFHTILALLFAAWLRENKVAAVAGVWITNPITTVPIYAFNYQVGRLFIDAPDIVFKPEHFKSMETLAGLGLDLFLIMFLGSIVAGLIAAIITYFVAKPLYSYILERHRRRKLCEIQ